MTLRNLMGLAAVVISLAVPARPAGAQDARAIVDEAVRYYRSTASVCSMEITIHRSAWQRSMELRVATRGQKDSIFFITAPPKDEGNGTLIKGWSMWTYNPRINRTMKVPPSMMSQSWMGSDFSYEDLVKADTMVEQYTHTYEGSETREGMKVHVIRSVPLDEAPVVWGMLRLFIREDRVLLGQEYYDEDNRLVRSLAGTELAVVDGRMFPRLWRMQKAEEPQEYTLVRYRELDFDADLPESRFTLSALSNPRR